MFAGAKSPAARALKRRVISPPPLGEGDQRSWWRGPLRWRYILWPADPPSSEIAGGAMPFGWPLHRRSPVPLPQRGRRGVRRGKFSAVRALKRRVISPPPEEERCSLGPNLRWGATACSPP
ncbi:hypothetical protein EIB18_14805 [Caulobacter vibrioides]|uniref:Uncharacterized protein n=1 Tax=Caulobacter vibrioides (strain ATCC 19089 / CIP 103742 / CB 15) TaxID=190650 RepID=Q9A4P1_CAUVC|nr:hypothetical protein CC_2789 [Caulobacter vibrioides CB15]ATC29625.1 hypothetical protein CA607_15055 [Caulobacter vibrioides]AZH13847.1 hypothetical protein EIB18_14805 [Caulobacter vibrioides]